MRKFEYSDNTVGEKEFIIAIPSMIIAAGLLSTPKALASFTVGSDGWIPLLIGGLFSALISFLIAKLISRFAGQSFFEYATALVSKPVAQVLTFFLVVCGVLVSALEVRGIADISKHYLFERTPVEVIALTFLLVVIYAVSGSRAGVLRLNILFLPIILFIFIVLLTFNVKWFELDNMLPMFQTDRKDFSKIAGTGAVSFEGYWIIWVYIAMVKKTKKLEWKIAKVMCIPVGIYLLIYIACIGIFGNLVTSNLIYPVVELAKEARIPGGIFERFESIFFVIWIMAIFTTTAMAFDIAVYAMTMLFKKAAKQTFIFWLAPLIYLIAMLPQNINEVVQLGRIANYGLLGLDVFLLILFAIALKVKGVKGNE